MTTRVRLGRRSVTVDKGIADVIRRLNECGFRTVASCSSLREDHPSQNPRDRSDNPYIRVEGKRPELIDFAEVSGWDWMFEGMGYAEDGKTPIDHVNFSSSGKQIFKGVAHTLEKPETDPNGNPVHWREEQTPSTKKEAICSLFPVEFTQLTLSTRNSGNDEFIKERTATLLEVITRKYDQS